ncbi:DUF3566 domain-containing protein [Rhodococcus sp. G-MC3]|uniref:DUF3566 domain-containing protein n=1 Tax=Rhodococcus sp. G-MC3 TaxID=3046209 RepID=UPI0024BB3E06|nr:DUF3566 domain-containing protein [Rhodococcus sp. G-MC3]MDJ0393550.1 DUF3566 domain-containing protein [Rhodococcus sp. G-MC3]
MSTPNRPGSRPVPSSEQAEQPRQPARPQPATRPDGEPAARPAAATPPPQGARPQDARPQARGPQAAGQVPGRPGSAQRPAAPAASPSPERPAAPQSAGQPAPAERQEAPASAGRSTADARTLQSPSVQPPTQRPPVAPRPVAEQQPPTQAAPRVEQQSDSSTGASEHLDSLRAAGAQPPRPGAPTQSSPVQSHPVQGNPNQGNPNQGAPSGPPPWQRGQRNPQQGGDARGPQIQVPNNTQNQPQTNLSARGGSLPQGGPVESAAAATSVAAVRQAGYAEDPDAKTQRREAAKSKAAVIDGPTRHIERKDLAKDMPDLSEVRHSGPAAETRQVAQPAAVDPREGGDVLRATIQLRKIDPWSTLKISLVIAVSLFFVWMVAIGLLYAVLDGMGVWDRLNSAFTEIVNESGDGGLVSAGQVFGYAAVIGIINVVLFTALTTIGSFIYNLSSDLVGGVEVTLADRD